MMDIKKRRILGGSSLLAGLATLTLSAFWLGSAVADGWWTGSSAPNVPDPQIGGIAQTRHNLTMSYNNDQGAMGPFRNNYYEVCVYCHTPHGANSTVAAPLWNRSVTQRNYTLYNNSNSLGDSPISQPGPNSLTCLSCHDGVTAIDSIINMPTQLGGAYRAGYRKEQESAGNFTTAGTGTSREFLDAWGAAGNNLFTTLDENGDPLLVPQPDPADLTARPANGAGQGHSAFQADGAGVGACIQCHNPGSSFPDFVPFIIGRETSRSGSLDAAVTVNINGVDTPVQVQTLEQDTSDRGLGDDHPIGVRYPTSFGIDSGYNEPDRIQPRIAYFDTNRDGHADPNEIRLYDTGEGYEVECGSCHDPHGVLVEDVVNNETKEVMIPSFLRVGATQSSDPSMNLDLLSPATGGPLGRPVSGNAGSKLCLTCHVK